MKRTRKTKAEPYVRGGGDETKSLSKLMNKAKRLVRNLERARVKGDKDDVSSIRTELRQTEWLIKRGIEAPAEPKVQVQKEKAVKTAEPKVQVARVERWVLTSEMHFGLVKAGFSKGCVFSVDRSTGQMTCEDTGETYPTCKDLDIAVRHLLTKTVSALLLTSARRDRTSSSHVREHRSKMMKRLGLRSSTLMRTSFLA
jgi:hypothetical protein